MQTINRSDFGTSLTEWIAFTMAFDDGVACLDKDAYLNLKRHTAAEIEERVKDTFALAVIRAAEILASDRAVFATESEAEDFVSEVAFVVGFARDPEDMRRRMAELSSGGGEG